MSKYTQRGFSARLREIADELDDHEECTGHSATKHETFDWWLEEITSLEENS